MSIKLARPFTYITDASTQQSPQLLAQTPEWVLDNQATLARYAALAPRSVDVSKDLVLEPLSYSFVVLRGAGVAACMP